MLEVMVNKNLTIFFPEDGYITDKKCNTCCYVGTSTLRDENNIHIDFKTLISDISDPDFASAYNKVTQYDIRRSYRDNLSFKIYTSDLILSDENLLKNYNTVYTNMYSRKGIATTAPIDRIKIYSQHNGVIITAASADNKEVVYHAYIVDGKHARLWMSCSVFRDSDDKNFRAIIGRANKRLHYEDMLYFHNSGYKTYDWGGITSFDEPDGIDSFKMSFGGERKEYYDETCLLSFRHKLMDKIRKIFQ